LIGYANGSSVVNQHLIAASLAGGQKLLWMANACQGTFLLLRELDGVHRSPLNVRFDHQDAV
jgi:hypothetical protein